MNRPRLSLLLFVILNLTLPLSVMGETYEAPPILSAKDRLPAKYFQDPRFQIEAQVPTDGFLAEYTINSDFGSFTAKGPGRIAVIINEIIALAKLEELENSDEFSAGAKDAADETADSIKTWIDKPAETAKGIPEGVGRFFKRTYRAAKTGVQSLGDVKKGYKPGSTQATGSDADALELSSLALKRIGQVTADAFGYDEARRKLAKHLEVDPYTTNPVLTQKLDEIAWASFSGSLGINVAVSLIPGGVLLKRSHMVTDWVWDMSPGDLRVKNDEALNNIGVAQAEIDRFLRHHLFTTTLQTAMVKGLDDLKDVTGRKAVIPWALEAENLDEARFMVWALRMLAQYHKNQQPLAKIEIFTTVAGRTLQDQMVVMAPVDYLSWSQRLHQYIMQPEFQGVQCSLWLTGDISDRAHKELSVLGWDVHTKTLFKRIKNPLE